MSKGSERRKRQVSDEEMSKRWELAFGKKKATPKKKDKEDK